MKIDLGIYRFHFRFKKVFSPAIKEAFNDEQDYVEMRDTIRVDWKPAKLEVTVIGFLFKQITG